MPEAANAPCASLDAATVRARAFVAHAAEPPSFAEVVEALSPACGPDLPRIALWYLLDHGRLRWVRCQGWDCLALGSA